jgi:cysteine desulfuration protein SufE
MTLEAKLAGLVSDLAILEDPQERLAHVVHVARPLPALPPELRTDARRVAGCVSAVWLAGELREGRCHFRCAADSPLVRGLMATLCDFFSGFPPADVAASELDPLEALGLLRNLTPTRRNGLESARLAIRTFAREAAA